MKGKKRMAEKMYIDPEKVKEARKLIREAEEIIFERVKDYFEKKEEPEEVTVRGDVLNNPTGVSSFTTVVPFGKTMIDVNFNRRTDVWHYYVSCGSYEMEPKMPPSKDLTIEKKFEVAFKNEATGDVRKVLIQVEEFNLNYFR